MLLHFLIDLIYLVIDAGRQLINLIWLLYQRLILFENEPLLLKRDQIVLLKRKYSASTR